MEIHAVSGGHLIPRETDQTIQLSREIAGIELPSFFGQLCGSHFNDGDGLLMSQQIVLSLAAYGDMCEETLGKKFTSLLKSYGNIKYLLVPEETGKAALKHSREKQMEFIKGFYNFPEKLFCQLMLLRYKIFLQCNFTFEIPARDLQIEDTRGCPFEVPLPSSHIGLRPLTLRLMCSYKTEDMMQPCKCMVVCRCVVKDNPSDTILFHLHGGGYVSQTSKAHEGYLSYWCKEWDVPILSVDYSLAPEAPHPRPLEEVFYAYCWMRANFKVLGTTGQRVVVGGNSSGGNLAVGLLNLCVKNSVPLPDSLFLGYPSLYCKMTPSPSRLLSLIDPFVLFPFLLRCLNAYTDPEYQTKCPRSFQEEVVAASEHKTDVSISPFLLPESILSEFPQTFIFTSDMDPCLDECIEFATRLRNVGVQKVHVEILEGLPHGYLSYSNFSAECQKAVEEITTKLGKIILARK